MNTDRWSALKLHSFCQSSLQLPLNVFNLRVPHVPNLYILSVCHTNQLATVNCIVKYHPLACILAHVDHTCIVSRGIVHVQIHSEPHVAALVHVIADGGRNTPFHVHELTIIFLTHDNRSDHEIVVPVNVRVVPEVYITVPETEYHEPIRFPVRVLKALQSVGPSAPVHHRVHVEFDANHVYVPV